MTEFIKLINDNSGVFNVIFTGVVAVATVVYAVLTARLVRETERLRAAATEPALEVTYRSRDEGVGLLDVVVKNIGSGPAYKIQFEISASPEGAGADELVRPLVQLKGFSSGINVLMPGQEFSSFWTDVSEKIDTNLDTIVRIKSTCVGVSGVRCQREHLIDLSELDGAVRLGTPPLLALARSVDKLQKDIHLLATGFKRYFVDMYSKHERDEGQTEESPGSDTVLSVKPRMAEIGPEWLSGTHDSVDHRPLRPRARAAPKKHRFGAAFRSVPRIPTACSGISSLRSGTPTKRLFLGCGPLRCPGGGRYRISIVEMDIRNLQFQIACRRLLASESVGREAGEIHKHGKGLGFAACAGSGARSPLIRRQALLGRIAKQKGLS